MPRARADNLARSRDAMQNNASSRAARAREVAAVAGLAALLAACGDNDQLPAKPARPIPGCETNEVVACDTRTFACQVAQLDIAACLRHTTRGTPPMVTVMTEQEYVAYINATLSGRDLPVNHFEVAMTWLGLAQPGSFNYTPLERKDIANWFGTFRWRENDLLLIDHDRVADDAASNVALVEALILSLRDRNLDIGTWSTAVSIFDVDSLWGGNAMYFGEARFYSNRFKAALAGVDASDFDELTPINEGLHQDVEWIRAQPPTYVATNNRFAHNFGARAMYLAWQRGGVDGVDSLFESKLLTHQLMASETEERAAPPLKTHRQPPASEAWNDQPNATAIGAWGLFLSLSRQLAPDAAWQLALTWRGDQIYVYKSVDPDDQTALVWQVEAADEDSAAALEQALASSVSGSDVQRRGTFVTLAIATNDSSLEWAFVDD
jgi:hypothetical protein